MKNKKVANRCADQQGNLIKKSTVIITQMEEKCKGEIFLRVLSLFDGMACGKIALERAGIPVERYVAYEVDKYAIQTSTHNFPNIEQRGDVFSGDFTEFKGFDLLMGGSPCTYWSIAQKNNRETEASGMGWELFSQYVRAIKEAEPKYFVYENNKSMSNAIRESISHAFGFEPICINSALVSAQSRQRLYWVGERNVDGAYSKVGVEQPEDRGILLKDILETGVAWQDKSFAYTTRCQGGTAADTLTKHRHTMVAEPVATRIPQYGDADKARPINAYYSNNCGGFEHRMFSDNPNKQQVDMVAEPVCVAQRGRYSDTGSRSVKGNGPVEQYYEAREDGKTNVLTTVQKDNYVAEPVRVGSLPRPNGELSQSQAFRVYDTEGKSVGINSGGGGAGGKTGLYAIPVEFDGDKPIKAICKADGKEYIVYEVKDGLINIKEKQYPIKLADGFYIIRKLTVRECMRLQTVPEWFEFPVSNSQAYKMLGNGWTVDVIAHILKSIKGE